MVKWFVKSSAVFLLISLFGCSSANNKPLLIDFSADSSSIVFNNIDRPGLLELKNMPDTVNTLDNLISVLQTPSETDTAIKELPVSGTFKITDSNIVFIPVQPFVKHRDYLVITHLNAHFGSAEAIAKGGIDTKVQSVQKLLRR